ncbi:MAG: autotransporter [Rhodospirillales bacterium]
MRASAYCCLLSLTLGGWLVLPGMAWSQSPLFNTQTGTDGSDGIHNTFEDDVPSTAGGDAADIDETVSSPIAIIENPPAALVSLTSTGGKGGDGDEDVNPSDGGDGGQITLTVDSDLTLSGGANNAVYTQSRGGDSGGGGTSTLGESYIQPATAGNAESVTVEIADGSSISVMNNPGGGSISAGAQVLSQGGDGGDGGSVGGVILDGFASDGGAAGSAATASLTLDGAVEVSGSGTLGVIVSADGGTGGAGGTDNEDVDDDPGNGGHGGAAGVGLLTIGAKGSVTTRDDDQMGVLVSVVGGDGGDGGGGGDTDGSLGGDGGLVADSESMPSVSFTNQGKVMTSGDASAGVTLQSVGGNGGDADGSASGGGGGSGGRILADNSGRIETLGDFSFGLFAQSVGGTGGDGGDATFGGGAGGDAGSSGSLEITQSGTITTQGDGAIAFVAQSVGGGNAVAAINQADLSLVADGSGSGGAGGDATGWLTFANRGGDGGTGGDGGDVTVTNGGLLSTSGANAPGLLIQSIGGGGATGGSTTDDSLLISISSGGSGGAGGTGGAVSVKRGQQAGSIATQGVSSPGIAAASIGGGGGSGGGVNADTFSLGLGVDIAIGGEGGDGNAGGAVTIDNAAAITTAELDSFGIQASSIGGGGGKGGQATADNFTAGFGDVPAVAITTDIGGSGGSGGAGGKVSVTNAGAITTSASQATGIFATSIGGSGGIGNNALAQTYTYGTAPAVSLGVTLGGSGGTGGTGGTVEVTNSGALSTSGFAADAIYAASIGGGGGMAGSGTTESSASLPGDGALSEIPLALGSSYGAQIAVGGSGGSGSSGGTVTITNQARVGTAGTDSRGLFAQSIGGGGGSAASGTANGAEDIQFNVSIGGSGGSGGDGGAVTVTNEAEGIVTTSADGSHGLQAQSVGAGGGSGGTSSAGSPEGLISNVADQGEKAAIKAAIAKYLPNFAEKWKIEPEQDASISHNLGVGGSGGAAGKGGQVTADNLGELSTEGNVAFGLFAQSIGGGGGNGGAATVAGGKLVNGSVGVGGNGGASGQGGAVTVTNRGRISTAGDAAFGVVAQSAGGGGGLAGLATHDTTRTLDFGLTLGGSTGATGDGDSVTVNNTGRIATDGSEAHGVIAQTIGGGGGIFLLNPDEPSSGTTADPELADLQAQAAAALKDQGVDPDEVANSFLTSLQSASGTITFDLGGSAEASGDGGVVDFTHSGSISTSGDNAFGAVLQSIGGGGGLAADGVGSNVAQTVVGTLQGGSGDGGDIAVSLSGGSRISTSGVGAVGLLAQSIGGGGGYSGALEGDGMTYDAFFADSSLGNGIGGDVTVVMTPNSSGEIRITTSGARAHGIFLQSLGGGGAAIGSSDGIVIPNANGSAARAGAIASTTVPGDITVNLRGAVSASGANAVAIYAQNGVQTVDGSIDPTENRGAIDLTFDGDLTGGSGDGAAIWLDGGSENSITFSGGTMSAASGTALRITNGGAQVTNSGTIAGDISMALPGNLVNQAGGVLHPGTTLDLASGTFSNRGQLNIAGGGQIGATTLNGTFIQAPGATWSVDIDLVAGRIDSLEALGEATLAGSVSPRILRLPEQIDSDSLPSLTLLSAPLSLDASQATVDNTLVVTYALDESVPGEVNLEIDQVAFNSGRATAGTNLTDNEAAAADHLQSIWEDGALGDLSDHFLTLLNTTSSSGYQAALQDLAPESHAVTAAVAPQHAAGFHGNLHSCPVFVGTTAALSEESCVYTRGIFNRVHHDGDGQITGYHLRDNIALLGGQKQIKDDWFLGGAFAYGTRSLESDDDRSSADGDVISAGLVVKKQIGESWLFAGSFAYGYSKMDNSRQVTSAGSTATATSVQEINSYSGRLRGAYNVDMGQWYLRPAFNLDVVHIQVPGYSETGAGVLDQSFDSASDTQAGFTPELEVGGRIDLQNAVLRPFAGAGVTYWTDSEWTQTSRLAAAPAGSTPVETSFEGDQWIGRADVGLDLLHGSGVAVRAQYGAQVGGDLVAHTGTIRLGFRF